MRLCCYVYPRSAPVGTATSRNVRMRMWLCLPVGLVSLLRCHRVQPHRLWCARLLLCSLLQYACWKSVYASLHTVVHASVWVMSQAEFVSVCHVANACNRFIALVYEALSILSSTVWFTIAATVDPSSSRRFACPFRWLY